MTEFESDGIPFTQYLLPHGRKAPRWIKMPTEIEDLAKRFIDDGGWFECEMLGDMKTVSLTACKTIRGEDQDIEIEVVENGPEIPSAVERLVRKAAKWIKGRK